MAEYTGGKWAEWPRQKKRRSLWKFTATAQKTRQITVEAETEERALRMIERRLGEGEKVIALQTNLL